MQIEWIDEKLKCFRFNYKTKLVSSPSVLTFFGSQAKPDGGKSEKFAICGEYNIFSGLNWKLPILTPETKARR